MTIRTSISLPDVHPFNGVDVWDLVIRQTNERPEELFLIWEPGPIEERLEWSYSEFAHEVEQVAAGLVSRGVTRGDGVMLMLENSPAFLFCWFACARLGAVAIDVNTAYSRDEIEHAMSLTGPVGVVTHGEYASRFDTIIDDRWLVAIDEPSWTCSILHGDTSSMPTRVPDPGAALCLQFTSGTTARPKAALFTHANALWGARVGAAHGDVRPEDVFLIYMPLFHTAALMWHLLPTLWSGGAVVLMPKYSASRFWDISLRNRCTHSMLLGISASTLASQPVPEHNYRLWQFALELPDLEQLFKVRILGAWGMTEVISNVIVGNPDHPGAPLSIGRPSPEYPIRIADEAGADVALGHDGELLVGGVRGLSLFAEYYNDSDATAAIFANDGYLRTGDCVRQLPTGEIQYVTRLKDMLKVGGENVAAAEIERACMTVPGVTAAAVVSRRDPIFDEVPVAFVVAPCADANTISDAVIAFCSETLSKFKVPREVHVIDELPESLLGKIAKAELRNRAAALAPGSA